jgi:hypothetical protein
MLDRILIGFCSVRGEAAIIVDSVPLMCRFKAAFALPPSRKTFRIAAEQAPRPHGGC